MTDGQPHREDDVAVWLKRMRDAVPTTSPAWNVTDRLLDRYRECSDYGLSLRPEDDEAGDP